MLTSNERVVGKRVTRKDSVPKVLGAAVYAGDLEMPGMIHGKTLRSIYPHAKILSIDTSEAEKIPGVHAVVTAKDLPGSNRYGLSLLDQEVLCEKKVRMVGDAIAFVAADTIALCEEALEKIKVEYEVLPAVLNVVDAVKDGAPLVHEDVKNNILQHTKVRKGELTDDVWASCAYIVENDYVTQRVDHAYIEPEACVAYVDTKGVMNILNSTQYTFRDRKQLAPVFNMPVNMVRVAQQTTGGGFGGKDDLNAELAAGILALKTGKPVRVVWTRNESMTSSTKRHPMFTHIKTGCDKDGKLIAVEGTITSDKGAYCSIGHFITKKMGLHLAGPYYVPHVKVDTYSVYTNNIQCGPYRGFGILQASFCHDSQMDQLAELVGISPMEIRKRNALKVGLSTATGQVFEHGVGFEDTLLRMEEYMAETELGEPSGKTKKRGRGIGSNLYGVGYGFSRPDHSAAMIEVADDGTATVLSGACDIGQGSDTAFCQIAAEALGIPYENVRIISADTCATPDALASTASRQTFVSGKAVQLAGEDAKFHLLNYAAELLGCDRDGLDVVDNMVVSSKDPNATMPFPELARAAHNDGKRFIGFAWYDNTTKDVNHETNQGDAYATYIYATQVADVEIDTETGEIEVLRVGAAHDVGSAINPMMIEQQIEGAILQGMGYGMMEEIILDKGYMKTPNFSKFLIPTAKDMPEMKTYIVESDTDRGPYGAKGVGEGAIIPTAIAVINAVYDAVGVRIKELPVTPEKILAGLEELKNKG